MAGIYLHIPYCKQKCSYCDFHFSTNLNSKNELISSLLKEIELRYQEINEPIETIYFGGGTPSILSNQELDSIFNKLNKHFDLSSVKEVTLEANPDDLTKEKLAYFQNTPINRFSIGIQSFFEEDLRLMNRAHNALEAENCIKLTQDFGFDNLTIDLIYGSNTTTHEMWRQNLQKAVDLGINHISSYALTVEEKTILNRKIEKGEWKPINDKHQSDQFDYLVNFLESNGFIQYEISNFGKPGYFSQHNSNYWKGIPYIGFGPSAHSFFGNKRAWNIANNAKYINNLKNNNLPLEIETLNLKDQYNEMMMIGLRTIYGIDPILVKSTFGKLISAHFDLEIEQLFKENLVQQIDGKIVLTKEAKFFADGIASRLFYVD
ncbi:radical SAM family heme chaperone HemW [Faecalibacter bovis]|uniref:Heme chaperone HemW n=1 Tax=Faecalibacter bovis TaxID=2898187 RepID=A0ABX7XCA7_9FLAO|nr:radical SAM family heme chaperone HemW [Faecalibacter bovis]QTV05533.1 radical SAM family heme chaperone HemW [Faecalibacter bovis]